MIPNKLIAQKNLVSYVEIRCLHQLNRKIQHQKLRGNNTTINQLIFLLLLLCRLLLLMMIVHAFAQSTHASKIFRKIGI